MCTRYRPPSMQQMQERFGTTISGNQPYNANLAPSEIAPILRTDKDGQPVFEMAGFGLLPFWAKEKKVRYNHLNARRETVREKPAFRDAYKRQRCIIPAVGFYEWRDENEKKQPYFFTRKDGQLILIAGLWDRNDKTGEEIVSFAILTGEPNAFIASYHTRMLVITDAVDKWLDLSRDPLLDLPELPTDAYEVRAVNPAMNNPRMKDVTVIDDWPQ